MRHSRMVIPKRFRLSRRECHVCRDCVPCAEYGGGLGQILQPCAKRAVFAHRGVEHAAFAAVAPEPELKGASALNGPFAVRMGGNIAKRPELAERAQVIRRLESYFAVIRADVSEVRGVFLDAPVVEEYDWLLARDRRLDCV